MTLNQEMEMIRGFDVAEVGIGFIDRWANALTRTALGSPEGPEPDKPSPPCRVPSLSQKRGK